MRRHRWLIALPALLVFPAGCGMFQKDAPSSQAGGVPPDAVIEEAPAPKLTASTHVAAGKLAESQGRAAAAIDQYRRAIRLEPSNQTAIYHLALLYSRLGEHAYAIDAWWHYVSATDGSASAFTNLAYAQQLAHQPDEAEAAYRQALKKDPAYAPAHTNFGMLLAGQGRLDEAASHLGTVMPPAQVHYNLAGVLQQQGNMNGAREHLSLAVKLNPDFAEAKTRLAGLDLND